MPSFVLAPEPFRKAAEGAAEKAAATKTVVIYPWTSTKALIRSLAADGFLRPAARIDFEKLRRKTFLLFLNRYGYTARHMAEAVGEKLREKPESIPMN